jgi:hypothetical protein
LAVERWSDFAEFGGYLGNVGKGIYGRFAMADSESRIWRPEGVPRQDLSDLVNSFRLRVDRARGGVGARSAGENPELDWVLSDFSGMGGRPGLRIWVILLLNLLTIS